jgi:glycosyltransferase involved in cell wall biosynthesis
LPALPRERALDFLAASDVCVFPSHWESFGIVTLEAMAAARAVIVTAGSGMAELVSDGRTGVIVRPQDPEDLSAAIIRLLGDPSLRMRLGLNARRAVVERFGLEAVLPAQLDHYQSVVARRGPAAVSL